MLDLSGEIKSHRRERRNLATPAATLLALQRRFLPAVVVVSTVGMVAQNLDYPAIRNRAVGALHYHPL